MIATLHDAISLSPGATQLNAAIAARAQRATVPRATMMEAFAAALPGLASSSYARPSLATLLEELAEASLLALPKSPKHWDVGIPALPEWIRTPTAPSGETGRRPARGSWRPELNWAYSAKLTATQIETLRQINQWFRDIGSRARHSEPLPLRERSHEIFDDEKRLDTLLATSLFAPERLTLEQLATFREPPPLAYCHLGRGDTLLVTENSDTYSTLRSLLLPDPGLIGYLAFGSGRSVEASIATASEFSNLRRILYFGDLDADGLSIPARASATAVQQGLPPIEPASGLYRTMLDGYGNRATKGGHIDDQRARLLVSWLPDSCREQARDLLVSGQRIAQEALNRNRLKADASWRDWSV